MPPRKRDPITGLPIHPSPAPVNIAPAGPTRGPNGIPLLKYTSLVGVTGALQTKNIASGFMKDDRQTWWNRRIVPVTDQQEEAVRNRKKRRMLGDETEEPDDARQDLDGDTDMKDDVEDDEDLASGSVGASATARSKGKGKELPGLPLVSFTAKGDCPGPFLTAVRPTDSALYTAS